MFIRLFVHHYPLFINIKTYLQMLTQKWKEKTGGKSQEVCKRIVFL